MAEISDREKLNDVVRNSLLNMKGLMLEIEKNLRKINEALYLLEKKKGK